MKKYILTLCVSLWAGVSWAQSPRSAYHMEAYVMRHTLNPAFQPDSSYFSLPVLGNTSLYLSSSMRLDDLLFDTPDGKITTFMSRGTISKPELMDRVGEGFRNRAGADMTLASWGRRVDAWRYQTLGVSFHASENLFVGKEYFSMLKDFENGVYDLSDTRMKATAYLEIAAGESRRLNDQWSVGIRGKMLLGIADMNLQIGDLQVNLNNQTWGAQGHLELNAAGIAFNNELREYSSLEHAGESYEMVAGMSRDGLGIRGLGLAVDAGVDYQYNDQWSFSASLLDLGFISWLSGRKAANAGNPFVFDGFEDACLEEPSEYDDPDRYKPMQSIGNQLDVLRDDAMDLMRLEDQGKKAYTRMLGVTTHCAATYRMLQWTFGALATARLEKDYSWAEARLTAVYRLCDRLDISLSPYYSTFGWGMGAVANYCTSRGRTFYLGTDHLVLKTNKQLIPFSLNGTINFGMTM